MHNSPASSLSVILTILSLAGVVYAQEYEGSDQALKENIIEPKALPVLSRTTVEHVIERYEKELMNVKGIVGVGIGTCDRADCIKVFAVESTPEIVQSVPTELEGIKVDIEQTGQFRTLPTE